MKKISLFVIMIGIILLIPIQVSAENVDDLPDSWRPEWEDTVTYSAQYKKYMEEESWECKDGTCTNYKGEKVSEDKLKQMYKEDLKFIAWRSEKNWECENGTCTNDKGETKSKNDLKKEYNANLVGQKDESYYGDIQDENYYVCNGLLSENLATLLGKIYRTVILLSMVVVVVMGMMDFTKATASNDADEMKKAWKKFVNRLIIAMILLMLPVLLEFIFTLFGNDDMKNCLEYF